MRIRLLLIALLFVSTLVQSDTGEYLHNWKQINVVYSTGEINGSQVVVRLHGVSTPSWDCPSVQVTDVLAKFGAKISATQFLKMSNSNNPDGSISGRLLLTMGDKQVDLGMAMIRLGLAVHEVDIDDSLRKSYLLADDEARAEGIGYWKCASPLVAFDRVASVSGVSSRTLYALAMNETKRQGRPWPWTLNVAGKSYYFPTRESAWRMADDLIAKGVTSIDIGVMQVNWKYHKHRFESVWEALQPSINQKAAADFLWEKFRQTGDAMTAVGWYHNASPSVHHSYQVSFAKHFVNAMAE